jgi:hypothetical protein
MVHMIAPIPKLAELREAVLAHSEAQAEMGLPYRR